MYKKKTVPCKHCGNNDPDQQQDIIVVRNGRRTVTGFECRVCGGTNDAP